MTHRSYQDVRREEESALAASGHAALCHRARLELPTAPAHLATPMRIAMLNGDRASLRALIEQCWMQEAK